jgi:hypothetical protein
MTTAKIIDETLGELNANLKKSDLTLNEVNKLEPSARAFRPLGKTSYIL